MDLGVNPGKIQTFDVLFLMILVNILSSAIRFQQPPSSGPTSERAKGKNSLHVRGC